MASLLGFFMCLFLALAHSQESLAQVRVAFVEVQRPDGYRWEIEPGERFAHVAISYKGVWLHTDLMRGVVLSPNLNSIGSITEILSLDSVSEPDEFWVNSVIGKPYDFEFDWANDEQLYCSELVAKALNIEPRSMDFSGDHWSAKTKQRAGYPGLSPDEVYSILKSQGWSPVKANCADALQQLLVAEPASK